MADKEKKLAQNGEDVLKSDETVEKKDKKAEKSGKKVAKSDKKSQKPEKKKGKMGEAWRGFKSELGKIVWPSWKQVLKNTGIVLGIVLICAVMIGALDYVFARGIPAIAQLF